MAHSSSGLGHRPLKAEIRGSNPLWATNKKCRRSKSSGIFVLNETVPAGPMNPDVGSRFDTSPRNAYRSSLSTACVDREVSKAPQRYTHINSRREETPVHRDCTYILINAMVCVKGIRLYYLHNRGDEHRDNHRIECEGDNRIDNDKSAARSADNCDIGSCQ